jgi:hypothetical protein
MDRIFKLITKIGIVFLLFLLLSGATAALEGGGTDTNPYLVKSRIDFSEIQTVSGPNVYFRLMTNLDFADYSGIWTPIGDESDPFKGIFDGNGYVIYNFELIAPTVDNIGFFGVVDNATILDLNFENATVIGSNSVGVLAGKTIQTNVSEIGIYNSAVTAVNDNAGGVVGFACGDSSPLGKFTHPMS